MASSSSGKAPVPRGNAKVEWRPKVSPILSALREVMEKMEFSPKLPISITHHGTDDDKKFAKYSFETLQMMETQLVGALEVTEKKHELYKLYEYHNFHAQHFFTDCKVVEYFKRDLRVPSAPDEATRSRIKRYVSWAEKTILNKKIDKANENANEAKQVANEALQVASEALQIATSRQGSTQPAVPHHQADPEPEKPGKADGTPEDPEEPEEPNEPKPVQRPRRPRARKTAAGPSGPPTVTGEMDDDVEDDGSETEQLAERQARLAAAKENEVEGKRTLGQTETPQPPAASMPGERKRKEVGDASMPGERKRKVISNEEEMGREAAALCLARPKALTLAQRNTLLAELPAHPDVAAIMGIFPAQQHAAVVKAVVDEGMSIEPSLLFLPDTTQLMDGWEAKVELAQEYLIAKLLA
jgi:hypothetical protein